MTSELNNNFRKKARDFKGRIEMMKRTNLEKIESLFLELFELGLIDFIQKEKERHPNKTHKEIIIEMYQYHDKLRGRKR